MISNFNEEPIIKPKKRPSKVMFWTITGLVGAIPLTGLGTWVATGMVKDKEIDKLQTQIKELQDQVKPNEVQIEEINKLITFLQSLIDQLKDKLPKPEHGLWSNKH